MFGLTTALSFLTPHRLKYLAVALLIVAVLIVVGNVFRSVYEKGYAAGEMQGDLRVAEANTASVIELAKLQRRMLATEQTIRQLELTTSIRIANAQSEGVVHVQTVEKVIHENPAFAAVVRPADLRLVRDTQLASLVAAATRGTATATQLSGASLRAVRPASPLDRREPRGN